MIYRFIAPGTHIVSDCFRAYCRIEDITERDFTHTSVNHEVEYVNEDGEHTNNIEALWSTLKRAIPPPVSGARNLCSPTSLSRCGGIPSRGLGGMQFYLPSGLLSMRSPSLPQNKKPSTLCNLS